jgi:hypothetical protein
MAIQEAGTTKKPTVNGKRQADAWGNVGMVDSEGKVHKFGGIPMMEEHYLTQALIEKTGCAIGESVENVEITLTLSFSRVDHEPKKAVF